MARTVMLSLVSAQAIPNVIAALHYQEDLEEIICLVSEDHEQEGEYNRHFYRVYEGLERALSDLMDVKVSIRPPVHPYDLTAVRATCQEVIDEYAERRIIFNVTGGTKVMALAAMLCGTETDCDIPVIYVETHDRQLIHLTRHSSDPHPFDEAALKAIDIRAYLNAYNVTVRTDRITEKREKQTGFSWEKGHFPDETLADAACFITSAPAAIILMDLIRSKGNEPGRGKDAHVCLKEDALTPEMMDVLDRFVEYGIITSPRQCNDDVQFRILSRFVKFIWGDWLEYFTFNTVEAMTDSTGDAFFDDCLLGMKVDWDGRSATHPPRRGTPDNEIDVAAIRGARLTICSCKAGDKTLDSDAVYQLEAVARPTGLYCDRILVTCRQILWHDKEYRSRMRRALNLGIVVVGLEGLIRLPVILHDIPAELERLRDEMGLWA
jgi:hypothetical protein